jgi:hypothetical protein
VTALRLLWIITIQAGMFSVAKTKYLASSRRYNSNKRWSVTVRFDGLVIWQVKSTGCGRDLPQVTAVCWCPCHSRTPCCDIPCVIRESSPASPSTAVLFKPGIARKSMIGCLFRRHFFLCVPLVSGCLRPAYHLSPNINVQLCAKIIPSARKTITPDQFLVMVYANL